MIRLPKRSIIWLDALAGAAGPDGWAFVRSD